MSQTNLISTHGYALTNDHPQIVGVGASTTQGRDQITSARTATIFETNSCKPVGTGVLDGPMSQTNQICTYGYYL